MTFTSSTVCGCCRASLRCFFSPLYFFLLSGLMWEGSTLMRRGFSPKKISIERRWIPNICWVKKLMQLGWSVWDIFSSSVTFVLCLFVWVQNSESTYRLLLFIVIFFSFLTIISCCSSTFYCKELMFEFVHFVYFPFHLGEYLLYRLCHEVEWALIQYLTPMFFIVSTCNWAFHK